MESGIGILILFFLVMVVIWILFMIAVRRLTGRRQSELEAELQDETIRYIENGPNFFGQRSKGFRQIRGNGVLALTDQAVHFLMWLPRRKVVIRRDAVTQVEEARTFFYKTNLVPLLKLSFINEKGEEDACAWHVRDLQHWIRELKSE